MRRSRNIRLVLLGGGVVLMVAGCDDDRARRCQEAKAAQRPEAEQLCGRATSSTPAYWSSWFRGRSGGGYYTDGAGSRSGYAGSRGSSAAASSSSAGSISRGGFGSTASAASSGS